MTGLVVSGWAALGGAGVGRERLAAALAAPATADVTGLYEEPLPAPRAAALVDFRARDHLGRKGTTFLDRATGLAMVACQQALADSGLPVDDTNRHRVGIVLGTTVGSLKSTCDFSRETLVNEKPYQVNPALFPNTVMNCAAGQAAIRLRLRGPNATVATGQLGFLGAVRYAANALRRGYADALLVGAVEEFSPHMAWLTALTGPPGAVPGEAAVVFVLEPAEQAEAAGRRPVARLLSVAMGYGGADGAGPALARCVRRVVAAADGAGAPAPTLLATGEADAADRTETDVVAEVLGEEPAGRLVVKPALGECQAASGALALAGLLVRPGDGEPPTALLTGRAPDGGVGAAAWQVLR